MPQPSRINTHIHTLGMNECQCQCQCHNEEVNTESTCEAKTSLSVVVCLQGCNRYKNVCVCVCVCESDYFLDEASVFESQSQSQSCVCARARVCVCFVCAYLVRHHDVRAQRLSDGLAADFRNLDVASVLRPTHACLLDVTKNKKKQKEGQSCLEEEHQHSLTPPYG